MAGSRQLNICLWFPTFLVLGSSTAFAQTLGAPSNLTAGTLTANRVDLSWQDAASGEDGFKIERAPDFGGEYDFGHGGSPRVARAVVADGLRRPANGLPA